MFSLAIVALFKHLKSYKFKETFVFFIGKQTIIGKALISKPTNYLYFGLSEIKLKKIDSTNSCVK